MEVAVAQVWAEVLGRDHVGATENFFDLGGDSLRAMEVISRLREELNVELPLIAFFEDPTVSHLAAAIRGLQTDPLTTSAAGPLVSPLSVNGDLPLSFAQLTFWMLQQRDTHGCLYSEPRVLRIRGQLRPDILERSLNEICRRHQVLRTRFLSGTDEPRQVIDPSGKIELKLRDLSALDPEQRVASALTIARSEWQEALDLSAGPVLRARLMRLDDDDHVLVIIMHHLVSDGHTGGIFFGELSAIYGAFSADQAHALPELAEQYSDYALRERAHMRGPQLEKALEFWRSHLKDAPPMLDLPTDRPRPEQLGNAGSLSGVVVPQNTVAGLKTLAQSTGGTLFTVMLGALRILLSRWTTQQDIVLGTVASNRSGAGSDRMVGCFLNFLPLRNTVGNEERALDVLGRERQLVMDAFAHQDCPFLKIAADAGSSRGEEATPIYNVAFLLQNFPEIRFAGKSFTGEFLRLETETALLDLRFLATERSNGLQLNCEFKAELFDQTTIEHLLQGFVGVLEVIATDPAARVSDIALPRPLVEQAVAARRREQKQTLAITATFTAEPVAESLSFWMKQLGIASHVEFAPYNQVFQQLLDPSSLLSDNRDGMNIVLLRMEDWKRFETNKSSDEVRENLRRNVQELTDAIKNFVQRSAAPLLLCICPPSNGLLGNPAMAELLQGMETSLLGGLDDISGVHVISSSSLMKTYPVASYEDEYADMLGHIPYTPALFTALGTMLARRISALRRPPHKVIVLDCDNTLWKGVCGEEGPLGISVDAPRRALQEVMIAQQDAGMVLCLCSKNAEEDVAAVFEQNQEMLLRREHIVASRINWEPKSHNLRELAQELQLGLDSFIFLDDNPLECEEVRANCPEVLTIELPRDPETIPQLLEHVWAFDHLKTTEEDKKRTALYRENIGREQARNSADNLEDFLAGLALRIDIRPTQPSDLARVAQLTERTNQFNFKTIRRTQAEIERLCAAGSECLAVDLKDRFGDYGLVGVLIFSTQSDSVNVDTFLLSCRALGRKVEYHMLARLGKIAQSRGLARVNVEYLQTKKNQPARDFVERVGAMLQSSGGAGTCYDFPSKYAASVDQLRLPENSPSPITEKQTTSQRSQSSTQPHVLAHIAATLRDVATISHQIESRKILHSRDQQTFAAPRTPTEEIVAGIWARLLKVERLGIHDNFFALGGHSLLATQVVARIRQTLGVELPLRVMFEAPTVAELTARIAARIEEARRAGHSADIPPLVQTSRDQPTPVSFAQQRLWFLDQLEPGNALYNVPQMFRMRGDIKIDALRQSLNEIVRRHEVLRTSFGTLHNEPVQVIAPAIELPLTIVSVQAAAAHREAEIQRLAMEEAVRPFDLSRSPLIRATLLRIAEDDHALILTMHHIVSDRWSMGVLAEELGSLYAAFAEGNPSPLRKLAIQYADFAAWQRSWLQGPALNEQLAYWKGQLAGAPAVLEFPTNRTRPAVQTFRGATTSRILPKELIRRLTTLSQSEGVTLFMTLLAAFQTLLSRYSGQEDIVVGSPIANRNYAEVEPLIGFFVNTLALRTDLSGDPTFQGLLARVKESALQAYAHQDIPFEKLVEELQPERSLSHNPIFQVMFALQNAPLQALELPGLRLERVPVYPGTSMFDMSWFAIEVPDGLMIRAEFNTDLFEESTIANAITHFENLLNGVAAHPERPLWQIPFLGEAEQRKLLVEFNATQVDHPKGLCIHDFFERQAEQTPDAIALVSGEQRLSYRVLNARANQVARFLRHRGIRPEVLVGICTERSADMLIGILGILKAGGAYVPLDPAYPKSRLAAILQDSGAPLVLTQQALAAELPDYAGEVLCLDTRWPEISLESDKNLECAVDPESLAYVLFTSGSTGRPKGVALEHRSAATFIHWAQSVFTPAELAGVLFSTSMCFDLSVFEMFVPLSTGGKIIMAENALHLPTLAAKNEVTLVNTVPSAMMELLRTNAVPATVEVVNLAGEALPPSLADQIYASTRVKKLYNLYGPTEDTTYSTHTLVRPGCSVTIGKPLANTQAYVLDAHRNPVPIGVAGELFLAGEGLARGYFGRQDLTAERFVPNPFGKEQHSRMYRTGDLCRWLANGEIEYLGRIDNQVKLRGFRIELGEIETVLTRHPKIRQCVVLAREDEPGLKRLVAYLASDTNLDSEDLRNHIKHSLPEFMVPSAFVVMNSLPLTPNGKIDRKALPAPEIGSEDRAAFVAPRNSEEHIVANIWSEVLRLPKVSVEEDFFSLGGHSLLATQVISRVRQAFHIELPLRALFETPTIAGLAKRIHGSTQSLDTAPIHPVRRDQALPLSFAQQRLWFLDQMEPGNPLYNIPWTLRMRGSLDIPALENSLNQVIRRHEALRTTFSTVGDQPVQVIHPSLDLSLGIVDFTALPHGQQQEESQRWIEEEVRRTFDLSKGPLLRANLLRLAAEDHILLLSIHHIVSDRWSMGLLSRELASLYAAKVDGKEVVPPALPIQYADFASWQREWLSGHNLEEQLIYWKNHLRNAPPVLEVPTDRPRLATETFRGATANITIPQEAADKLNKLSHSHDATLFMTLLAGFSSLLSHYSGQQDIVLGTPIANRNRAEIEGLVGFFANTLPLRMDLSGNPTFGEIIARTKETALGAYAHQDMPFEKLVEELRPERSLSHNPLVQVFFVLQNAPLEELQLKGLQIEPIETDTKTAKGDIFFWLVETPEGLRGRVEYNTDLFNTATIERMLGHYQVLLEAAVANPATRLSELPLLTTAERDQVLVKWNSTAVEYPQLCLHQLITAQARLTPERVAVVFGSQQLTYSELEARSNQLARHLRKIGVSRETLVGLCVERSLDMVVALLGILKAGGAYVPLDPSYPADRIQFILEDAQAPVLITQRLVLSSLTTLNARTIILDTAWPEIAAESTAPLSIETQSSNLAYVLYTSGSTGKPKGVQIEHRNLVNFLASMKKQPGLTADDTLLAVTTLSFDIAGLELYLPLITGAKLVLASQEEAADGHKLLALLHQSCATVLQATPATWRMLLDSGWTGTSALKALCGGEAMPADLAAQLVPRSAELWNMYGPTETTIWSSIFKVEATLDSTAPIGRPIDNTTMYVLDAEFRPVPIGVAGELYLGGDGVARGYFNRPELTAEKFLADPFRPGECIYRTGDLAKFLPDGNIQFLGRADFQVKVRGFRIELGEIESVLARHADIQQVVVIVREDQPGDPRLVAYLVVRPGQNAAASDLRTHLKQSLPDYMVPSYFVTLDTLPLTPNGKIDRKALPKPEYTRPELAGERLSARTPAEEVIAGIWAEVLQLDQVGVQDDFFELGGHSLLATQVVSRVRQAFQVELPLRALFEAPSVAGLAERVVTLQHKQQGLQTLPLQPVPRHQSLPLSFAQQRLWFLDQMEPNNPLYNLPYIVRLQGTLRVPTVEKSLHEIVRRHESLRTTFQTVNDEPVQVIIPELSIPLVCSDLTSLPESQREDEARHLAMQEVQHPFDLKNGPLLRALLLKLDDADHVLILNTHHIISDRWSLGVLSQELAALYETYSANKPSPLPDLTIQYADYAVWQRNVLSGPTLQRQLEYWKEQLAGAPNVLELPTDRPRQAISNFWGNIHRQPLSPELVKDLRALSRRCSSTFFMTLMAAFQALLARQSGQKDIVVGTDLANRTQLDTEKIIGFFVNLLPIRTRLIDNNSFQELLGQVRQTSLGAFAHQDIPFDKLVEELRPERSLTHNPLVQVLFVMQNTPHTVREFGGLKVGQLGVSSTSRFDLVLFINDPEGTPYATWMYNPNLFDASTIARMAGLYQALLQTITTDPEIAIDTLTRHLDEIEKQLQADDQKRFQEASVRKLKGIKRRTVPQA
jgi:amino acid adenylation domain-containing protein/FkbH-like protein